VILSTFYSTQYICINIDYKKKQYIFKMFLAVIVIGIFLLLLTSYSVYLFFSKRNKVNVINKAKVELDVNRSSVIDYKKKQLLIDEEIKQIELSNMDSFQSIKEYNEKLAVLKDNKEEITRNLEIIKTNLLSIREDLNSSRITVESLESSNQELQGRVSMIDSEITNIENLIDNLEITQEQIEQLEEELLYEKSNTSSCKLVAEIEGQLDPENYCRNKNDIDSYVNNYITNTENKISLTEQEIQSLLSQYGTTS
jgi:chromosome segregation ATPase